MILPCGYTLGPALGYTLGYSRRDLAMRLHFCLGSALGYSRQELALRLHFMFRFRLQLA